MFQICGMTLRTNETSVLIILAPQIIGEAHIPFRKVTDIKSFLSKQMLSNNKG